MEKRANNGKGSETYGILMAGFLDKKERIVDYIITPKGKEILSETGRIDVSFVSFDDKCVIYKKSGEIDQTNPNDKASTYNPVCESYDMNTGSFFLEQAYGRPISEISKKQSEVIRDSSLSIQEKIAALRNVLDITLEKFDILNLLKTNNFLNSEESGFELDKNMFPIRITREDIDNEFRKSVDITTINAVFQDRRFHNIDNFTYLPPVVSNNGDLLGEYPEIGQTEIRSEQDILNELKRIEKQTSFCQEFNIQKNSDNGNIVLQFIEVSAAGLNLLDIHEYGDVSDKQGNRFSLFYVGKVYKNKYNALCFLNIFTVLVPHNS